MKTLHLKKTLLDLKRLLCPDDRAFALPKKVMYIYTKPAMRLGLKIRRPEHPHAMLGQGTITGGSLSPWGMKRRRARATSPVPSSPFSPPSPVLWNCSLGCLRRLRLQGGLKQACRFRVFEVWMLWVLILAKCKAECRKDTGTKVHS